MMAEVCKVEISCIIWNVVANAKFLTE